MHQNQFTGTIICVLISINIKSSFISIMIVPFPDWLPLGYSLSVLLQIVSCGNLALCGCEQNDGHFFGFLKCL